jgi:hypothetical protein
MDDMGYRVLPFLMEAASSSTGRARIVLVGLLIIAGLIAFVLFMWLLQEASDAAIRLGEVLWQRHFKIVVVTILGAMGTLIGGFIIWSEPAMWAGGVIAGALIALLSVSSGHH